MDTSYLVVIGWHGAGSFTLRAWMLFFTDYPISSLIVVTQAFQQKKFQFFIAVLIRLPCHLSLHRA